MSIWCSP